MFHRGPDLIIGAQLYLVDEQHSVSFDEKLAEFQGAASTQLESVWWLPSRRCAVNLILSNTGDLQVTAQAVLNAGTPERERVDVTLSPHETRVIKVQRDKPGKGPKSKDDVGSASINHTGPKGSLIARALIKDEDSGYSLSAQFYSPQGGRSSDYQGVGLRLGKVRGQELTPIVVARNVGDVPTSISGRVPYTTTGGSIGVVQLPKVRLAPGEAASIEIEQVIKKTIRSRDIATAALEFDYTTAPGSVMMSAQSVSEDNNQVFRVPMWDVPAQRNGTGGYPWFIKGDSSTFVYIKNVTDKEQKYTFSLTYEGGDYSTGVKSIKAGQTVAFDLRAIRDDQIPDERSITIPLNAKRGKIVWSVRGPDPLALLGRSEQADLVKGTSSSYACFMCCPNTFRSSRLNPASISLTTGNLMGVRGVQRDSTCYGGQTPEYYMGDTWTSSNSSVATVEGFGDEAEVTGVGGGTATIKGHWEVYTYTSTYSYEYSYHYCETASQMTEPERPVEVVDITGVTASGATQITQTVGNTALIHFVTAKGASGSTVTLTATLTPDTQANRAKVDWEGATENGSNPLQAAVSKDTAAKHVVKIKIDGQVVKELRVWVVWATLSGGVASPTVTPLFTPTTNRRTGTSIQPVFNSTATIAPSTLITDTDRPDLSGANTVAPPGGQALSSGADKKWDVSRRRATRINITAGNPSMPDEILDVDQDFPTDPLVGNDDHGTSDETNNPYSSLFLGQLTSHDAPTRTWELDGGNVNQIYVVKIWFQEFARMIIGDSWFIISDPLPWRVEFRFKKIQVTEALWNLDANGDGDMNDNITEAMLNADRNGDGDTNDSVGYWSDDGSVSANDNQGAP